MFVLLVVRLGKIVPIKNYNIFYISIRSPALVWHNSYYTVCGQFVYNNSLGHGPLVLVEFWSRFYMKN